MIIGHKFQWQILKRTFERGKIAHAYLFCGAPQSGKRKVGVEFIKLLNCGDSGLRPCQKCRPCKDIEKGIFPDFILIEPEENEIKIGVIRKLRARLVLHPFVSQFKAVIIDRAHLLNSEAQSALLKTLEEPKGQTLFILTTEFPKALLPTILSRLEILRFHPVNSFEIEKALIDSGASALSARRLAASSLGRPGRALNLLNDSEKRNYEEKAAEKIIQLGNSTLAVRFQYVKEFVQSRQNANEILDIWLGRFREILLSDSQHTGYSPAKIKKILETIQNISELISTTNVNQRLALEMLMLEL